MFILAFAEGDQLERIKDPDICTGWSRRTGGKTLAAQDYPP